MKSLKQTIMQRDGLTSEEADDLIFAAREELIHFIDIGDLDAAENICCDHFGLEPDYLDDLI